MANKNNDTKKNKDKTKKTKFARPQSYLKFNLKEFQNSVIITLTLSHSHTIRTEGTQNPPPSDPNPFKLSPINNIFPMENSDSAPSTSPPAPLSVVGSFFFCLILTFPNSDILFFFFFFHFVQKKENVMPISPKIAVRLLILSLVCRFKYCFKFEDYVSIWICRNWLNRGRSCSVEYRIWSRLISYAICLVFNAPL